MGATRGNLITVRETHPEKNKIKILGLGKEESIHGFPLVLLLPRH
jgi:hypothetical protein